jgi:hypothetical protein
MLDFAQKLFCYNPETAHCRIRRENPFHADTPFENGSGGVDEKSSAAAAFGGGVQA